MLARAVPCPVRASPHPPSPFRLSFPRHHCVPLRTHLTHASHTSHTPLTPPPAPDIYLCPVSPRINPCMEFVQMRIAVLSRSEETETETERLAGQRRRGLRQQSQTGSHEPCPTHPPRPRAAMTLGAGGCAEGVWWGGPCVVPLSVMAGCLVRASCPSSIKPETLNPKP
jgi:hypothetical protein